MRCLAAEADRDLECYASLLRYGDPALVAQNTADACARGYRFIKLHEVTREAVLAAGEAGADVNARDHARRQLRLDVPEQAAAMAAAMRDDKLSLAGRAGLAAGRLRGPRRVAPHRHPDRGGRECRRRVRFQVADRRRRDRHRAAERHQDRRHRRNAARYRPVPRFQCRGRATLPLFRPWLYRDAAYHRGARPDRRLVEVLWLDMEAHPFHDRCPRRSMDG